MAKLNKLYYEFIDRYILLNKELGIDDISEMYYLYLYLLDRGYLPKNNKFKAGKKGIVNSFYYLRLNILNGTGVCKNIASLLNDILLRQKILSSVLTLKVNHKEIKKKHLHYSLQTRDEKRYILMKYNMVKKKEWEII